MRFAVVGAGRCGTRLLREMLDHHPGIYVATETHWIPLLWERFGSARNPAEAYFEVVDRTFHANGVTTLQPLLEERGLSREELRASVRARLSGGADLREFHDAVGAALASRAGKPDYGEKTADYGAWMGLLQALWPRLRFVHMIRDGRDSALSMYRHAGFRRMVALGATSWPPLALDASYRLPGGAADGLLDYLRLWQARVRRMLDESRRVAPGSCLVVRYEDLVRDPEAVLRRVAGHVGLPTTSHWVQEASGLVRHRPVVRARALTDWLTAEARETLAELGYA